MYANVYAVYLAEIFLSNNPEYFNSNFNSNFNCGSALCRVEISSQTWGFYFMLNFL